MRYMYIQSCPVLVVLHVVRLGTFKSTVTIELSAPTAPQVVTPLTVKCVGFNTLGQTLPSTWLR